MIDNNAKSFKETTIASKHKVSKNCQLHYKHTRKYNKQKHSLPNKHGVLTPPCWSLKANKKVQDLFYKIHLLNAAFEDASFESKIGSFLQGKPLPGHIYA